MNLSEVILLLKARKAKKEKTMEQSRKTTPMAPRILKPQIDELEYLIKTFEAIQLTEQNK